MIGFIGLDLSLTNTAICACGRWDASLPDGVWREALSGSDYTFFRLHQPASIPTMERWRRIVLRLMDVIEAVQRGGLDPWLLIEGYAFGAVRSPHSNPYELGGVVRYELYNADVRWAAINPTTLKKFVTGSGRAPKSQVLKEVLRRWGLDLKDDNEADAFGLARLGEAFDRYSRGDAGGLIKPQVEVMKTLAKKGEGLWH